MEHYPGFDPVNGRDRAIAWPSAPEPLDFTSSLYLGMHHPTGALAQWSRLTTGKPASLETPPAATSCAAALASLQGCEGAILLPSTLHLFFDLFEVLRRKNIAIYADVAAYKIALWGAERAAARGAPLRWIAHRDASAARLAIATDARRGWRPVILADGFCPACGRPAPLLEYVRSVEPYGGYVVLDDTQALGIWGRSAGHGFPYGLGGGGSLRRHGLRSPRVVLGASLAKAFGVPVAALSGSEQILELFREHAETLVHCSPPSIAVLHAAADALDINALAGDRLRQRLAARVARFRRRTGAGGLHSPDSLFPMQLVVPDRDTDARHLQRELYSQGVRTAVVRGHGSPPKLLFVITTMHSTADIDRAAAALAAAARNAGRGGLLAA